MKYEPLEIYTGAEHDLHPDFGATIDEIQTKEKVS